MLIRRSELRLALTAGLMNGFGALAAIPFGYYAPMAVLAVCTGTYGGSIALGRQRLLGSVAGAVVLLVSLTGLGHLPVPLGLSLSLVAMRLLGAVLGLEVGYKVGSNIIVMGWLVHGSDLNPWLPVRLFWTVIGILGALLSLRLFWPDLAVEGQRRRLRQLLDDLAVALIAQADRIAGPASAASAPCRSAGREAGLQTVQSLRRQLVVLRGAMPAVADELGNNPTSHPTFRLFELLQGAGSGIVGVIDGLRLLDHRVAAVAPLADIHEAEADLLHAVAGRLQEWSLTLERPHSHRPSPPAAVLAPPHGWQQVERWLHDPDLDGFDLDLLQRNATRLVLCSRALRSVEQAERRWHGVAGSRS